MSPYLGMTNVAGLNDKIPGNRNKGTIFAPLKKILIKEAEMDEV